MPKLNKTKFLKSQSFYLVIVAMILVSLFIAMPMISAQTESEATEESTISNIKKVIQDKQAELGQNNQQSTQLKQAYLAQVKRVSAETLTVLNNQTSVVIPLTEDLEIVKKEKQIKIEEVAVDDWVIVYSVFKEDLCLPKRILLTEKDFTQEDRKIMVGTITELYSSNLLFDSRTGESDFNFLLDKNTQYFDVSGDEISLRDLYSELQCLIVATAKTDGQWRASSIKALVDLSD
jgi:hypothetical protein